MRGWVLVPRLHTREDLEIARKVPDYVIVDPDIVFKALPGSHEACIWTQTPLHIVRSEFGEPARSAPRATVEVGLDRRKITDRVFRRYNRQTVDLIVRW